MLNVQGAIQIVLEICLILLLYEIKFILFFTNRLIWFFHKLLISIPKNFKLCFIII